MEPFSDQDEFEIDNLTIEVPDDHEPVMRQSLAQEVIGQLPELLRRHAAQFDEE
ncbi:MAG TPA: hypothetical protein VHN74_17705 [Candidatus Angelobacter sp.]|jgi:hypothetical protein|nr:hypothetical protein [Candidatus Angelobacter sp.]